MNHCHESDLVLLLLLVFCKLQKVNLLMVGEYTELVVLNCYIYIQILHDMKITDNSPQ
ncbi:hypothetical protein Hanom_Chr09g00855731 [Helianthus anomalus]